MIFTCSGHKISNLTFYDLKQFYTQAKNYALNISEIEAKVREATNDDPWGASSTLMQEIAQAYVDAHSPQHPQLVCSDDLPQP